MITNMDEAMAKLVEYIPAPGSMHRNYKLDRMRQLMELLGNPQDSFKSIHIAGTSGKTSTAYFLRGLLQAANVKNGLTVSPHIMSVTERVQVNGEPITDEKFIQYLNELLRKVEASDVTPTYYELLVALAYMIFREEQVDYAVIETGLGGLLDATNVITRLDKLSVITDIGFDHTEVLGNTIEEIAKQKTGIVQPGNILVLQHQDEETESIIIEEAKKRGSQETIIVRPQDSASNLPSFQRRNYAAAVAAYQKIAERDGLPLIDQLDISAVALLSPPGRMEMFTVRGKTIIFDGAHNGQKMHALVEALSEQGLTSLGVLASFTGDEMHRLEQGLQELMPIVTELVATNLSVLRDMGKVVSSAHDIAEAAHRQGYTSVTEKSNPHDALEYLLDSSHQAILVTGSLYLVAQLRSDVL